MPITIGQVTTEIVARPEEAPAPAAAPAATQATQLATVRAQMAAIARQIMRTRAQGFDD